MDNSYSHIDYKYKITKMLGIGFTSKVFLAVKLKDDLSKKDLSNETNESVALKIYIPKKTDRVNAEIDILKKVDHDNIVKVEEHRVGSLFLPDSILVKKVLFSTFKNYENGDFFDFIKAGGPLTEKCSRYYFKQLLNAVKYLHTNNIAHRDIKLENIFLDEEFEPILGDFGFAINFDETISKEVPSMNVGTKGFQSPEYLERNNPDYRSNDIFSLGVVLFIICFGGAPFNEAKSSDFRYKFIYAECFDDFWNLIKKATRKENIDNKLTSLLNGMLRYDDRFTIEDIEKSEWLGEVTLNKNDLIAEMTRRKLLALDRRSLFNLDLELCTLQSYSPGV